MTGSDRESGLARTLKVRALIEQTGGYHAAAKVLGLSDMRVRQIALRWSAPPWVLPPKPVKPPKPQKPPRTRAESKRCTKCLLVKPAAEFYKRGKTGLWHRCRPCANEAVAASKARHEARS